MAPKYLVVIQGDYLAYLKPHGKLGGNGKKMYWESPGVSYHHLRSYLKYPWRKWSVTHSHPNYNLQFCDIKNRSFKNGSIVNLCWGKFVFRLHILKHGRADLRIMLHISVSVTWSDASWDWGLTSSLKFVLHIFKTILGFCKWNCKALKNTYIAARGPFASVITAPACISS